MPTDVIIDPTSGQIYWNNGGGGNLESISIKGDALNAISFVGYGVSYSPGSTPSGTTLLSVNDNGGTDLLIPGTNGYNLGSSTLRWNTFATNANLSGTLLVADSTISSSLLVGSVRVNGGIAVSGNASIGQSLNFYNPAATFYTGFKAGTVTGNTLYTLPLTYPSTGTSVLQSDTSGIMSWVPMSAASSSSGGTVSSGTQYQIAGYYSGTGASVSGSSTFLNNTSTGQIQIAHTTASFGTSSGALQVAGGVGISGRLSFNQAAFGTTGISTNPSMAMIGQTGDPIYMTILEDNSLSFEGSQGQLFSISPNLSTGYIWAVNDISGVPLLRSNVNGNSYIAEFGGYLGIGQTNPAYKLDVRGNFGLASSNDSLYNFIFSNSAASGSNSFQVRSANSILFYNSGNTFYTGFKSNASANKLYVLPATDGSNGQFLQTDGNQNLTWATASGGSGSGSSGVNPGGQYEVAIYAATGASVSGSSTLKNDTSAAVVSISHNTISTNYTNGALTVSGGVGIGGSLYVGGTGSSISGVRFASGVINLGTWNGTVIGVQYGGTGQNLTGASGILTISSGTVSNSTTSSAIASALSDETGSGSLVFGTTPTFTTSVVTGDSTFAVFNTNATTINAFGAASTLSIGANTGTATFNSTNNTTAANTGSVVFSGGVGIGKSVSVGGRILLFNGSTYTGFASSQVGTGSTIYFFPTTTPATGTSVLQSDSTGVMSWVPMTTGGAGSVNSGTATYAAYYATTTNAVSQNANLQFTGSGVSVGGNINSSSTTTGSLLVWGGLGITGNAFIGGTVYVPSTTASNISNLLVSNSTVSTSTSSGALVVTGGVGIGGSLYTATGSSSSISGVVLANNTVNATTYNKVTITAPASSATLTLADGSSLVTSGGNSLTLATTAPTSVTLPTSGTLVNTTVTSLASLTTASSLNSVGTISTGAWSATAITSHYGGTGLQSPFVVGDILYATTTTTWGRLAASSTSGQVLTSNGSGNLPTWQAVPPAAASSVAVAPTVVNASFYIPVVNSASSAAVGLSSVSTLVINPSNHVVTLSGLAVTALTQSTSTTTGALTVAGGAGIAYSAFIGGMLRVGSNTFTKSYSLGDISLDNGSNADTPAITYYYANNRNFGHDVYSSGAGSTRWRVVKELNESGGAELFSIDTTGAIQLYSGANYSGFRFTGTGQTIYTLPSQSPQSAVGTSVLTSTIEGVMSWVGMSAGGSGSPAGSNKQIQYNNSSSFGGAAGFEYTTGGTAVTVSVFNNSGTGYTAGLWVHSINGTTTRVGIGLSNPTYELEINGEISATNKSFVIDHPTKSGMKLRYGSLEGPENGVYVRGELKGTNIIEVPDHWVGLVYEDSYTVHLTPIGRFSQLYVEKIENYNVYVADNLTCPIHCYYSVWAERKDIPKLVTEYEAQ